MALLKGQVSRSAQQIPLGRSPIVVIVGEDGIADLDWVGGRVVGPVDGGQGVDLAGGGLDIEGVEIATGGG